MDSNKTLEKLPKYENPPVVETVMGAAFRADPQWNVTHYGRFYETIRSRYPKVEPQPPLPEDFDESPSHPGGLRFEFLQGAPDSRCWFIDPSDSRLLQVQADRFLRNWRKRDLAGAYPHYQANRAEFETDWSAYLEFRRQSGLAEPTVRHCEITYINLLEQGAGWTSPGDLHEVFRFWSDLRANPGLLPLPNSGQFKMTFHLPNGSGRLNVDLQNVVRVVDGKEMLQLTLTARGRPVGGTTPQLLDWFDLGHSWIVRGFDELTTKKMHEVWKRKDNS